MKSRSFVDCRGEVVLLQQQAKILARIIQIHDTDMISKKFRTLKNTHIEGNGKNSSVKPPLSSQYRETRMQYVCFCVMHGTYG